MLEISQRLSADATLTNQLVKKTKSSATA